MHEVGERLFAVDRDDGDPLPVGPLELGISVDRHLDEAEGNLLAHRREHALGALAQVTPVREVDGDLAHGPLALDGEGGLGHGRLRAVVAVDRVRAEAENVIALGQDLASEGRGR